MESIFLFVFLVQTIIHGHINVAIAQNPKQQVYRCKDDSKFLSDSQQKHRDSALDALSLNITVPEYTGYLSTQSKGFRADDVVNAVMLCPPNIKPAACANCIKKTVPFLKQNCPKQKEGVGWTLLTTFDSCMVRYAGYEIFRKFVNWTHFRMWNQDTTSDLKYNTEFEALASEVREQASDGGARRKFATGFKTYGPKQMPLYVALQCTPDLLKDDCRRCLVSGISIISEELSNHGRWSGRVMYPNCYVRFAHENFLPRNNMS